MRTSRPPPPILVLLGQVLAALGLLARIWQATREDLTDAARTRATLPLGVMLWAAGFVCLSNTRPGLLHLLAPGLFTLWCVLALQELLDHRRSRRRRR